MNLSLRMWTPAPILDFPSYYLTLGARAGGYPYGGISRLYLSERTRNAEVGNTRPSIESLLMIYSERTTRKNPFGIT